METVVFTRGERVERGNNIQYYAYQARNGTVFFVKIDSLFKGDIYVTFEGNKVRADESWTGEIRSRAVHGDELYFRTKDYENRGEEMIYKASFHPSSGIKIDFVRDMEKDEEGFDSMMLLREKNGVESVSQAWSDESIVVDVDKKELMEYLLIGVHKKKLIYVKNSRNATTSAEAISPNVTVITVGGSFSGDYMDDSSPLIYLLADWINLIVVNTNTMEVRSFGTSVNGEKGSFFNISGVHEGKICVLGEEEDANYLYTAKIPVK
ncbi:hypothetical protein PMAYCL1PPCAC_22070 [Pristionchus mayeri]|uniref:Uncharacterized protein n=1 Tax=Pristionchus mayeri TaxID=1317129 RepID=A0AAN5CWQ3_9BILA|nr:hypothetical protein PMAYCL1PPCAC_22070 [Pristionchus mayeri]